MVVEIERKFLVKGEFKAHAINSFDIVQGYLSPVPERSVRVRIKEGKGYLTIKGIGNESGVSRYEWEREIQLDEAKALLEICEPGVIKKTRYVIEEGAHMFEVDEFFGDNKGLIIAEVELRSEDEKFDKPVWLGREVTGDVKYYNAMLMKKPFLEWD